MLQAPNIGGSHFNSRKELEMYEDNAVILNLLDWRLVINFNQLRDAGVSGLILDLGNSTNGFNESPAFRKYIYPAHRAGFRRIGVLYSAYAGYWMEEGYTMAKVSKLPDEEHPILQHILRLLNQDYPVGFFALTIQCREPRWGTNNNWNTFTFVDIIRRLQRQMNLRNIPNMRLGIYGSREWISINAPYLDIWLGNNPDIFVWVMDFKVEPPTSLSISEIVKVRPNRSPQIFGQGAARKKEWDLWQWTHEDGYGIRCSDAVTFYDKAPGWLGLNLFNGTPMEFYYWSGVAKTVAPKLSSFDSDIIELLGTHVPQK